MLSTSMVLELRFNRHQISPLVQARVRGVLLCTTTHIYSRLEETLQLQQVAQMAAFIPTQQVVYTPAAILQHRKPHQQQAGLLLLMQRVERNTVYKYRQAL